MIDIGANLAHESFAHDLPQVLARAAEAGLTALILTGSCPQSNVVVQRLVQQVSPLPLYATAGLHPHHAEQWNAAFQQQLAALLPTALAAGECGLDYFRDLAPRAQQREAFIGQLQLAAAQQKPVFLHQREAHEDFLAILKDHPAHGVVHCFTDTPEAMHAYLDLGFYIGITGWVCDERRGQHLQAAIKTLPDDRLLIETDAPYLLPRNAPKALRKAHRNEPAYLPYVVEKIAELRGQSAAHVRRLSVENAWRCFGLMG
jgi:TatD DNase family protein